MTTRLVLRPDVYAASTDTGLCVLTHRGPVSFEGSSIGAWLDRLRPHLDGRFGLEDLAAGLDDPHRAMLRQVVRALVDADIVRELPESDTADTDGTAGVGVGGSAGVGGSTPEERYVGYFRTSADAVVRRYRECPALVVGSGPWADALARACARSGVARVDRVPASALLDDPAVEPIGDEDGPRVVLHVADPTDPETIPQARRLSARCRSADVVLGHLTPLGDRVLLGPVGTARQGPGWEDAWRRLVATGSTAIVPDGADGPNRPGRAERAMIANQLVHLAFRASTGVAEPGERDQVCDVAYEDGSTATHPLVAHPCTSPVDPDPAPAEHAATPAAQPAEHPVEQPVEQPADGHSAAERLDPDEMSRRTARLVDDRTGVFVEIAQRGFAQFPIHVSQVVVSDPMGLAGGPVRVFGTGPDFATARYQAALRGYAVYGSVAFDPRRLLSTDGQLPTADVAFPWPIDPGNPEMTMDPWSFRDAYVRGRSLVDGGVRLLDPHRAFPALGDATRPEGARWPVLGSASGYDPEQAVTSALLDHCRALAVTALASATPAGTTLDGATLEEFGTVDLSEPSVPAADPYARRYAALLRATGRPVTAYDLTCLIDVPTVLLGVGGERDDADLVCATGVSLSAALRDALEQALLAHQARTDGEATDATYAPRPLGLALPPNLPLGPNRPAPPNHSPAGGEPTSPDTSTPRELGVQDLTAALTKRGHHPVVLSLDHDPEVTRRMPHIVQVVLDA